MMSPKRLEEIKGMVTPPPGKRWDYSLLSTIHHTLKDLIAEVEEARSMLAVTGFRPYHEIRSGPGEPCKCQHDDVVCATCGHYLRKG